MSELVPLDNDLVTPQDVERAMVDLVARIDRAPRIIEEYHNSVRRARRDYKRAYALAYSAAKGTNQDRKIEADLKTQEELKDLDQAEIEYKLARDRLESLRAELRALQSISSLMKAAMFGPQGGI